MSEINSGRMLLTFVLIVTAVVSVVADWNASHLFNPEWHPHARFHDVAMLNLLCGMCGIGLWLLWRRSSEPEIGVRVAALVPVIFWLAFFYGTWVVPGANLNAMPEEVPRLIFGVPIYINVIIAAANTLLAVTGYLLYRREHACGRTSS